MTAIQVDEEVAKRFRLLAAVEKITRKDIKNQSDVLEELLELKEKGDISHEN